jgi:CHAT domain-containing protein
VYNQISIYTLQNPSTKKFTIDEVQIQVVTNTKDLVAFAPAKSGGSSNDSFLFGYPNYNMGAIDKMQESTESSQSTSELVVKAASEGRGMARGARGARGAEDDGSFEALSRGGIPRGIRGNLLRYMRSNQLLALLPGTQREVNLIDSLYAQKAVSTKVFMSDEAIEEKIKEVKNPKTLHIATHGFFLEQEGGSEDDSDKYVSNPLLRSGLILAGANSFISTGEIGAEVELQEDGILTAYEAMNLNLDETELVVLSACETGLGEVKNGEGVFGLQRAFQVAGADAMIMSMWTVDDDATQELMTNFYEEWLTTGDKQQAFIVAQKRLKDKWKAPYYWGAFVMVGN